MSVPEGWKKTTVGEACAIKNHLRLPIRTEVRSQMKGAYPYFGPTGILGYIDEFRIDEEFALIGEDGDHFLKYNEKEMTVWHYGKANVNNHAHIICNSQECLVVWFQRYFQHRDITDALTRQGAKRYKLTKNALEHLEILLPPLAEQKKIAAILSTWDKAIEATDKLLENARQQKKALMQQLLVEDKKRLPGFSGKWRKQTLHKLIHEQSLKNKNSSVSQVLSITNHSGFYPPEKQFSKRVASEDISNYKIARRSHFGYNPSRLNVGSFGRLDSYEVAVVSPLYVIFKIDEDALFSDFFLMWMKSDMAAKEIISSTQGSVRDSVNFDALERFAISLPPLPEQQAIARVLTTADKEIDALTQKVALLRQEKRALMQQLLTGKKRVRVEESHAV